MSDINHFNEIFLGTEVMLVAEVLCCEKTSLHLIK